MTTHQERTNQLTPATVTQGFERLMSEDLLQRFARFERLAIKIFQVANCFVKVGKLSSRFPGSDSNISAQEAAFCDGLPVTSDLVVVSDLSQQAELKEHRFVCNEPYLRFLVLHPLSNHQGVAIGSLILLDYQARPFDDEEKLALRDLAHMIEQDFAYAALFLQWQDLQKQNRNLKRESLLDPLLGAWNKSAIIRSLRIEIERCQQSQKPLSVLVATLDQISACRQSHGVATADLFLINTVSRLRSCIRPFDALGRYGDDMLMVVLPGASHLVSRAIAERIRLAVYANPEILDQESFALTLSIGTASTDAFVNVQPEELIALAEKALLNAKQAGNSVTQALPAQPDLTI